MADLIDRDALEPFYESGTDPDDSYADMTYIRAEHIENAPAVKPEVRHGEWHESWYTDTVCASICTNCGKATTQARTKEDMTNVRYPLCPYCGADMGERGGEQEWPR